MCHYMVYGLSLSVKKMLRFYKRKVDLVVSTWEYIRVLRKTRLKTSFAGKKKVKN